MLSCGVQTAAREAQSALQDVQDKCAREVARVRTEAERDVRDSETRVRARVQLEFEDLSTQVRAPGHWLPLHLPFACCKQPGLRFASLHLVYHPPMVAT